MTYWDYLGWKDTYAKPGFAARQHTFPAVKLAGLKTAVLVQSRVAGPIVAAAHD